MAKLMRAEDLSSASQDSLPAAKKMNQEHQVNTVEKGLLAAIHNDQSLPALGTSISQIVRLSSSDDESIRKLTYFVLSDVSLTQKVLRLSNSVSFRADSTKAITSVSKAIFLLGFNTVKACALAIILVDAMAGKEAKHVKHELVSALAASMVSRELARKSCFNDAEEVAVAALFKNLGRLLLAAYYPDHYQDMVALMEQDSLTSAQASKQILQFDLDNCVEKVLETWEMPASIIQTLKTPSAKSLQPAKNRLEWMQQAVELSDKAVPLVLNSDESQDSGLVDTLLTQFGKALSLDKKRLDQLITNASKESKAFVSNVNLSSSNEKREIGMSSTQIELNNQAEEKVVRELAFVFEEGNGDEQNEQRYPSGKPYSAASILLAGVQDLTEITASGKYKLSDLITLSLETFYNSLGFRFITLCLRDQERGQYRARSSFGSDYQTYQKGFVFPLAASNDLFHLAMKNNVDLVISDATVAKVRSLLPEWHTKLLPNARSFIVLPLVVNEKRVGLFYADRQYEAPEGISSEEMRLIKTLKAQVVTALHSR